MRTHTLHGKILSLAIAGFAMLAADALAPAPFGSFVPEAQAVVGRPLTPGSVAGVARRTTRRVIRRSTVYVAALPTGCVRTSVNGTVVWRCGGVYYQPYGGRYVVVYID
ncbi:hypothetical protein BHMPCIPO_04916 [Ensifer sesbaniae]|nr:hypothetical protein [Ensifer sesbaniae]